MNSPDEKGEPHLWGHVQEGVLAEAGVILDRPELVAVARRSALAFIVPQIEIAFAGPMVQPYAVASAVYVMDRLHAATGEAAFATLRDHARAWFDGRNTAGLPVYDRATGRVNDGIDHGRLNLHSGAEANIVAGQALLPEVVARVAADGDAPGLTALSPGSDLLAVRGLDEHRAWRDRRQGGTVDDVLRALVEAGEGLLDRRDALEPFHRRHAVAAGHDEAPGRTVLRRERSAVHRVRDEHVVRERVRDRQRALERDLARELLRCAAVRPAEEDLPRARPQVRPLEQRPQGNARPLRGPDGAEPPLLAGDLRLEVRAAVARAFERHGERSRGQRL